MRKILIGALAAMLLVAACGGSSKKSDSGSSPTTKSGSSGSSGNDEFSQLTAKAKTADVKLTFTGEDGKSSTYAQDGKGKTAFTTGDSTIIYDGTNTISCSGTGSDASCTQIAGSAGANAGAFITTLLGIYAGINSSVTGGHVTSDNIAGRDASCVSFKASDYAAFAALAGSSGFDTSAAVTTCADKETGFLLKLAGTSNNTEKSIFLATAFESSSPSDFEPPVPPSTVPSFTVPSLPTGVPTT